jgi:hypothetical protein
VRTVHHHADGVHLPHQYPAVGGKSLVDRVEAASARRVAVVVARQHRADTEFIEPAYTLQPPRERTGILQVEGHGHVPVAAGGFDVADTLRRPQAVVRGDPLPPAPDQAGDVLRGMRDVTNVHRHETATRPAVANQLSDIGVPLQRQTAVLLPQQARAAWY